MDRPVRIAMIGAGYVGLVSGACLAELGACVACVDNDTVKTDALARGDIGIYEPGLAELVASNQAAGRLLFTADLAGSLDDADAIFIAVGTPSRSDGNADLRHVYAVAEMVGATLARSHLRRRTVIVTKSTVPVGTGAEISRILGRHLAAGSFDVASNPEFLREGSAVADFMRPERIVVGAGSEFARQTLRTLYRPLELDGSPIVFTTLETAELIKYAANAFLAAKIAFVNEVADFCEAVGADVQDVACGIGLDSRIGRQFLKAGPGFGGSCFPKDCRALVSAAAAAGAPLSIVASVLRSNEERQRAMARKIVAACGGVAGKTLAVLGLTFKADTDDMRDSPSLTILPILVEAGATIRAYDPQGMVHARKLMPALDYCDNTDGAINGADALVVLTEWSEFCELDPWRLARVLRNPLVIDLRNIFRPQAMAAAGLVYHSIGRDTAAPEVERAPASADDLRLMMLAADS